MASVVVLNGKDRIELDGRMATIILALLSKRREITGPYQIKVTLDCAKASVKLNTSITYVESELGLAG